MTAVGWRFFDYRAPLRKDGYAAVAETRLTQKRRWCALPISLLFLSASPLQAAPVAVDIPGLPLVDGLDRLSSLFGISVGSSDALDPSVRTKPVHGHMDAASALHRMLAGTGLREQALGMRSFRLVAVPKPASPPVAAVHAAPIPVPDDIIVSAAKRRQPLSALAGEEEILSFDTPLGAADRRGTASDLVTRVPTLSSTHLGPGRDKLFLRGIADSSFSGRSQGTLGEYLGEARLNTNTPDPGLLLYDMKEIEILKGPQGTLYGGGTLAGVLRFEPERPDLNRISASADLVATATQAGAPGYALATTLNLPIAGDMLGSRLLAYRTLDGGYIRDPGRGKDDVNATSITGFRGQLRAKPDGWTIDLLATHQRIASRDSSYAERGLPPYTRSTSLAQPSRNIFTLIDLEARRHAGGVDILSTTSLTWNRLGASYDATVLADRPAAFRNDRDVRTLNHETRFSHTNAYGGGWLLGAVTLLQWEDERNDATAIGDPRYNGNLNNRRFELAAFGDYSWSIGKLMLTAGARLALARLDARTDETPYLASPASIGTKGFRALPMAMLTWRATPRLTVSLGYRQSYRSGFADFEYGDQLVPALYRNDLVTVSPDTIHVANLSFVRRGGSRRLPFTIETTVSGFVWTDIQTDLIDTRGFISAASGSHAELLNVDMSISLRPSAELNVRAGLSLNKEMQHYAPDVVGTLVGEFASIAPVSGYADATWSKTVAEDWTLQLEGRLSYIGKSALGQQTLNAVAQGRIVSSSAVASLKHERYAVSLSIDNVADRAGNMFAYGNPFTLRQGRQITPQRPRSVTMAVHADF